MNLAPGEANIFLAGFMLSGKTTVGRELARMTGRRLIDTDAVIEASEGKNVPEIFAESGEPAFRAMERAAVEKSASESKSIVALGGGALMDEANLAAVRKSGVVYYLHTDAAVVVARASADPGSRPLLKGADIGQVMRMMDSRDPTYRRAADRVVDASRPAVDVASDILADFESRTGEEPS